MAGRADTGGHHAKAGGPGAANAVRRAWRPEDAERWLSFLSHHLERTGSRDLAWWQLHHAVQLRPVHRALAGTALGLVFAISSGAAGWLVGLLLDVPGLASVTGFVGGLMVGLAFGLAANTTATPAYADLRPLPGRISSLLRTVGYGILAWLVIGMAAGTLLTIANVPVGITGPSVIGSMFGLVHGFMIWVATPVTDYRTQSPSSTLRGDVQLAVIRTAVFVLFGGVVVGLLARVMGELAPFVIFAVASAFTVVLLTGAPPKVASSVYLGIVSVLVVRGEIPMRLMMFLKHTHQLGLLRQAGPVYQFRHAMLQDRLAEAHRRRVRRSGSV